MTFATRDQDRVVRRLIQFAGDPAILEDALEELRSETAEPPSIDQLLRKILELREERGLGTPNEAAAAGG